MRRRHRSAAGFTLVEVVIALAILAVALVPMLFVAAAAQRFVRSQSEASDLQQRVRVAADRLRRDLAQAGASPLHGSLSRGLASFVAPIVPARSGIRSADGALTAFGDRLTVIYVPDEGWQATLSASMSSAAESLIVDRSAPGCSTAGLCGFTEGSRALVFDPGGVGAGHDVFTVTGIAAGLAHDAPNLPLSRPYSTGAIVVPIVQRTYYFDRAGRRLMVYDGYQSDVPLVDNVVDLRFEYFVDPSPSSVAKPKDGSANCVYDAGPPAAPLLDDLGGAAIQPLPLAQLTDGPACGTGASLFDGDLLRIRLVRVTLRLQAAADDVRGAGAFFARPGRSTSGFSLVPDFEISFDVAPRNLAPIVEDPS